MTFIHEFAFKKHKIHENVMDLFGMGDSPQGRRILKMLNSFEFANFLLNAHDYRTEGAKCHSPGWNEKIPGEDPKNALMIKCPVFLSFRENIEPPAISPFYYKTRHSHAPASSSTHS